MSWLNLERKVIYWEYLLQLTKIWFGLVYLFNGISTTKIQLYKQMIYV